MKKQPNRNYKSDDVVMTPPELAKILYKTLSPTGNMLDPSRGEGAFFNLMPENSRDWCEITEGRDFFEYNKNVDWIITNPPWSLIRPFLQHSMTLANDIAFLCTINHLWTRARIREIYNNDFRIKNILLCDTPKVNNWPSTGFQLGMFHISKGHTGDCKFIDLRGKYEK